VFEGGMINELHRVLATRRFYMYLLYDLDM
jgi:hypothetical protein